MLRLASASPRRIALMRLLETPFEITPADVDEERVASPATAKADAVSRRGDVLIAADTVLELDGRRVGKPADEGHAVTMLADLAARGAHVVRTEVVVEGASGRRLTFAVRSRVNMAAASLREIERYVASGEPLDKAGAYAIQGEGARLVATFDGCLANITGLPLCHAYFALRPEGECQRHFDFICPVWRAAQRQGRALYDGAEYESWREDVAGRRPQRPSIP